jgi:hypothetical protein
VIAPTYNEERCMTAFDEKPQRSEIIFRLCKSILLLFAIYYICSFIILAVLRIPAFIEYEWLEGLHLHLIHRILAGLSIYSPPSLEYAGIIYPPLYIYFSAGFSYIFGEGYFIPRLISFFATLGSFLFIGKIVTDLSGSKSGGLIAAGLYAGMYGIVNCWYDFARIDALYIFFTLAAIYWLRTSAEKEILNSVLGIAAAVCAIMTKQTAWLPILAVSLFCLSSRNRKAVWTIVFCFTAIGVSQVLAGLLTDNWFYYYVYKVPATHPVADGIVKLFFRYELLPYLSCGFMILILSIVVTVRDKVQNQSAFFLLLITPALIIAGLLPRLKLGGAENNLMPIAAALALGGGVMFAQLNKVNKRTAMIVIALFIGINLQILYRPQDALPSNSEFQRTQILLKVIKQMPEPMFTPCHLYLPIYAGKNSSAYWGSLVDLFLTQDQESIKLSKTLEQTLKDKKFKTIILKTEFFQQNRFPEDVLRANYRELDLNNIITREEQELVNIKVYVPRT